MRLTNIKRTANERDQRSPSLSLSLSDPSPSISISPPSIFKGVFLNDSNRNVVKYA